MGPFSDVMEIKKFMNNVAYFEIKYNVLSIVPPPAITNYNCFEWKIRQHF